MDRSTNQEKILEFCLKFWDHSYLFRWWRQIFQIYWTRQIGLLHNGRHRRWMGTVGITWPSFL